MRINNPFEVNDWDMKEFLIAVVATELVLWVLLVSDSVGFEIPIVQQFFGVLNLLFLPGVLLLRVFRLHKLGSVETLLYTVGLSLAFSMAVGFLLNAAGAINLISRPLSFLPLLISTTAGVLALSVLAYVRDKNFNDPAFVHTEGRSLQWALFLCFLPFLSVFGTYLMNNFGSNALLLIFYIGIGVTMLYIAFDAKFPKELYPLAIFTIALALLFSTTLISPYVTGWDIQLEYYYAALIVHNGAWNWTLPSDYNGMLSVVMIAPMISILGKIDLNFVFKIAYALLFALVPAGLYAAFKRITTEKIAFLSAFFVVFSSAAFFIVLPSEARQQIAELFLALILLLLVSNEIKGIAKTSLLFVFSFSMVVSHYSLSVIYIGVFLASAVGLNLIYFRKANGGRTKASKSGHRVQQEETALSSGNQSKTLSFIFVFFFIVVLFVWYSYVSSGSIFTNVVLSQQSLLGKFAIDLGVSSSTGLAVAAATIPSPLHEAATWMRLLSVFFIFTGLIAAVLKRGRLQRNDTYLCIGLGSFAVLLAAAVVPNLASFLDVSRFYQIATLTLAPFCIAGGIFLVDSAQKYLLSARKPSFAFSIRLIAVLLLISFLLDSGTLYQVIEHESNHLALDPTINWPAFNTQEMAGANWWYAVKDNSSFIYADTLRVELLFRMDGTQFIWSQFTGEHHVRVLVPSGGSTHPKDAYSVNINATGRNSYVFLGTKNIEENGLAVLGVYNYVYLNQSRALSGRSEVYDNGGAQIYFG